MTAQWDDDIHHAIHTAVSGERQGYYGDFGSLETLAQTLQARLLPRGHLLVVPAPAARPPAGHRDHPGDPAAGVHADPRPGRQPRDRRPAVADPDLRPARGQGGASTRIALHGNAFHGRGMGVVVAVPVLQLAIPSRSWPGPPPRAASASSPNTAGTPTRSPTRRTPQTFLRSKLNWDEVDDGEHARLRRVYQRADRAAPHRTRSGRSVAGPPARRLRRGPAVDRAAPRLAGHRLQSRHRSRRRAGHRRGGAGVGRARRSAESDTAGRAFVRDSANCQVSIHRRRACG